MQRSVLIVLSSIFLIACGNNVRPSESLGEYDMPVASDTVELVYTYQQSTGRTEIIRASHRHLNDGVLRRKTIWINGGQVGESYYKLTGTTVMFVKEYQFEYDSVFMYPEKVPGRMKTFKTESVGKKIEDFYCTISFTNRDGFRKTFNEFMTYEKDTVLLWNGAEVPCVKLHGEFKESKVIKYLPFMGDRYEYNGVYYYGKGIGYMKSILYGDGWREETNLISIERKPFSRFDEFESLDEGI